jgi:hypothetical protein
MGIQFSILVSSRWHFHGWACAIDLESLKNGAQIISLSIWMMQNIFQNSALGIGNMSEFGRWTDENLRHWRLHLESPLNGGKLRCHYPFAHGIAQICYSDFRAEPQNSVRDWQSVPGTFCQSLMSVYRTKQWTSMFKFKILIYSRIEGPAIDERLTRFMWFSFSAQSACWALPFPRQSSDKQML